MHLRLDCFFGYFKVNSDPLQKRIIFVRKTAKTKTSWRSGSQAARGVYSEIRSALHCGPRTIGLNAKHQLVKRRKHIFTINSVWAHDVRVAYFTHIMYFI